MTQEKAIQEAKTLREKILAKISSIEHRTIGNEGKFAGRLADSLVTLFQEQYASSSSEKGDAPTDKEQFDVFLKTRAEQYSFMSHTFTKDWCKDWEQFIKLLNQRGYYISKLTHQFSKQFDLEDVVKCLEGQYITNGENRRYNEAVRVCILAVQSLTPKEHSEGEDGECPNICHKGMTKPSRDAVCYQCGKPW